MPLHPSQRRPPRITYDGLGRLRERREASGALTVYTYAPGTIAVANSIGGGSITRTLVQHLDALGRIVAIEKVLGGRTVRQTFYVHCAEPHRDLDRCGRRDDATHLRSSRSPRCQHAPFDGNDALDRRRAGQRAHAPQRARSGDRDDVRCARPHPYERRQRRSRGHDVPLPQCGRCRSARRRAASPQSTVAGRRCTGVVDVQLRCSRQDRQSEPHPHRTARRELRHGFRARRSRPSSTDDVAGNVERRSAARRRLHVRPTRSAGRRTRYRARRRLRR